MHQPLIQPKYIHRFDIDSAAAGAAWRKIAELLLLLERPALSSLEVARPTSGFESQSGEAHYEERQRWPNQCGNHAPSASWSSDGALGVGHKPGPQWADHLHAPGHVGFLAGVGGKKRPYRAEATDPGAANSGWPVWSPDGRTIAFDSDRDDPDPADDVVINDIFTMDSAGGRVRNLTGAQGFSADAAWSPDGRSIAFDYQSEPATKKGIYTMRRDGSQVQQITALPPTAVVETSPRYSPDGSTLVFTRFGGNEDFGNSALFTVRVKSRQLRQVTPFAIGAGDADWSPDGRHLVFEAAPLAGNGRGEIEVIRPDGSHLRQVIQNRVSDPVWSPDGKKILYMQGRLVNGVNTVGLATVRPDGTHQRNLSATPMEEHQPDWESINSKGSR